MRKDTAMGGFSVFVAEDLARSLRIDPTGPEDQMVKPPIDRAGEEICSCDGKLQRVTACLNNANGALLDGRLKPQSVLACRSAIWCALQGITEIGERFEKKNIVPPVTE